MWAPAFWYVSYMYAAVSWRRWCTWTFPKRCLLESPVSKYACSQAPDEKACDFAYARACPSMGTHVHMHSPPSVTEIATALIRRLKVAPDASRLATASADNTVAVLRTPLKRLAGLPVARAHALYCGFQAKSLPIVKRLCCLDL